MDGEESQRMESLERENQRLRRRNATLNQQLEKQRAHLWQLEGDLIAARGVVREQRQRLERQEAQLVQAQEQIRQLQKQVAELSALARGALPPAAPPAAVPPAFVKANVAKKDPQPWGRKAGHAAALRPMPAKIDRHVEVPAPRDGQGVASCPTCHTQLSGVKTHQRIVEDIAPTQKVVTCYHTTSGYCPHCRKVVETRLDEQPPAPPGVDLPQGQLGLNALSTAVILRMVYRLPFRQVAELLGDLTSLSISSGAVAQQLQRTAEALEGEQHRLTHLVRASPVVHMDETGWRIDGRNHWLWTMLSDRHTVFHVDQSRGQKVVDEMLGADFGGTLVSDFYGGYGKLACPKQKCLVHLLRELKQAAEKHPAFATGAFHRRGKRLTQEMLLLKKRKGTLPAERYEAKGKLLERRVHELAQATWDEPQAQRLAKRLRRHGRELTHFLWHDAVDGTNNAAERALRPAVVARKISGGSRSHKGARATAILLSVLRTAQQQDLPLLESIQHLLQAHWAGKKTVLLTDLLLPQPAKTSRR